MASSRQPNFGRSNFKLLPSLRRVQSGVPKTAGGTHRHQQVPAHPTDQSLNFALVVAFAGPAEPVGKHVMRLQLAEHARPLPPPVAQDPRHRQGGVVVQDRARHLAEEAERGVMSVTERFGALRRIGLYETGVAVRQVHRKEVDLALSPGDLRQCLAKVALRMPSIVPHRHKNLALPQPTRQNVVFHNGDPAGVAVLVAKPFEDPLRVMSLFLRPTLILRQDGVDDPGERIQLRARRRPAPPIPRRNRKRQHLRYRPRVDPVSPRRFPPAQTLNLNRITNLSIKLHALHPPAPVARRQRPSLPDFYSGATGLPGRFSEGFLLRRLQAAEAIAYFTAS